MEENRKWEASWIWASRSPEKKAEAAAGMEMLYFRRSFEAPENARLVLSISADSRYRLYVNGESVCVGPCKGDRNIHYYDTVDVSHLLRQGGNVIAVQAVHYTGVPELAKRNGPSSIWRSEQGVLLVEGVLESEEGATRLNLITDALWKVFVGEAVSERAESFTLFVGGPELADGRLMPHGWQKIDYDDTEWQHAEVVSATADTMWGQLTPWQLTPRPIPFMMEEAAVEPVLVRWSPPKDNGTGEEGRVVEAGETLAGTLLQAGEACWFELDAGELMCGYVRLRLAGGKDAELRITYSECYEYPIEGGVRNKGFRHEWRGKRLYGPEDVYIAAGAAGESYEPFHRRTFRYIRLEVRCAEEPLELLGLDYRETGYPLTETAEFNCSDESLHPLWKVSLTTLKRCMHETYEDTPYYEQMQYEMDARLQILFTYYVSGDDRLARKTIHDFHSSLLPSGLLQSRYPSIHPQVIPGFSLYWIMMVHDHYLFFGDKELVRRYMPTIEAILGWFERQIGANGLLRPIPEAYWSFVDWVSEWDANAGAPPAARGQSNTIYSLMYAYTLERVAELADWMGRKDEAELCRTQAADVKKAAVTHSYDFTRSWFQDSPGAAAISQHTQLWAVLSGAVQGDDARHLIERTLSDKQLPRVSYAMVFFMFRAMSRVGCYEQSYELWDAWRAQIKLGLTTWVEDPVRQRSDCHGWGAAPLYEFSAEVLGVKPGGPGWSSIVVEPKPGPLSFASGKVCTSRGVVAVEWSQAQAELLLKVDGPQGAPLTVRLPSGRELFFASSAGVVVRG